MLCIAAAFNFEAYLTARFATDKGNNVQKSAVQDLPGNIRKHPQMHLTLPSPLPTKVNVLTVADPFEPEIDYGRSSRRHMPTSCHPFAWLQILLRVLAYRDTKDDSTA